jgi:hypothetical protein
MGLVLLQFATLPTLSDGTLDMEHLCRPNVPPLSYEFDHIGSCALRIPGPDGTPRFLYTFGRVNFRKKVRFPFYIYANLF